MAYVARIRRPLPSSYRIRGLSGLGGLDTGKLMVQNGQYTFYFTIGGMLALSVDPNAATKALLADSNFARPTATIKSGGWFSGNKLAVSFIYAGKGSTVGNAGAEMQSVLNHYGVVGAGGTTLYFESADGPDSPNAPGSAGGPPPASSPDQATPAGGAAFQQAAIWQLMNGRTQNQGNDGSQPKPISWGTIALAGGAGLVGVLGLVTAFRR